MLRYRVLIFFVRFFKTKQNLYTDNDNIENLYFANDAYDAAKDADAICLVTEWQEFRLLNWEFIKQNMHTPLVIDGRNIYDKKELINLGFKYLGIGK